jgi:hypothetical protein
MFRSRLICSRADPGKQLTGTIMGAFMSCVLVPHEHDVTRLLLKVVLRTTRWTALGLRIGDLIMARRQLLNFKQLAERHQHQVTSPAQRQNRTFASPSPMNTYAGKGKPTLPDVASEFIPPRRSGRDRPV